MTTTFIAQETTFTSKAYCGACGALSALIYRHGFVTHDFMGRANSHDANVTQNTRFIKVLPVASAKAAWTCGACDHRSV